MKIEDVLNGARLITLPSSQDARGSFVKIFHDSLFRKAGIEFVLKESYYSTSAKNVIRGMHFQLPPHQHSKIVYCPQGAILDVVVDLRKSSFTYGKCVANILSSENNRAFYVPEGFAHGFKSLTDNALMCYLVSSEYHPESDTGIAYNSIGFNWEVEAPVLSARDLSYVTMADFDSPF